MISDSQTNFSDKPARERILLTAHDLFYRDGIRATGIDKVISESRVTKVTFYRHFPSKNDLIRAFLDYRHRRWMDWFVDALKRQGAAQPGGGLKPLVAVLDEWFSNPVYRGCAFINTVAEFGDTLPDVLDICSRHKQDMIEVVKVLLPESESSRRLANAVAIAIDGAIVRAQFETNTVDGKRESLESLAVLLAGLEKGG